MPRTKLPKSSAKRVRDVDNLLETRRKEFDQRVEFIFEQSKFDFLSQFDNLQREITNFISKLPEGIKKMTLNELGELDLSTFAEVENSLKKDTDVTSTSHFHLSAKVINREDEGYSTEASSNSNSTMSKKRSVAVRGTPLLGPLASARARSRRSKSASALQTPAVLSSALKATKQRPPLTKQTPVPKQHSLDDSLTSTGTQRTTRLSRSQYRTPGGRAKAASADRLGPITPKAQFGTPMAILRYPRLGETLLSTCGSPVAALPALPDTANIAIPLHDRVLSVRPNSIGELDIQLLNRIDPNTLDQLKRLQQNLTKVISSFNQKLCL